MNKSEVWKLARQAMQGLAACYADAVDQDAIATGLTPQDCYLVIIPARLFDPDPISADRMRKRIPYNAPAFYEAPFQTVKEAGFLEDAAEGGYLLNQQGHIAFRRFIGAIYQKLEPLVLLPNSEMEELRLMLARLVQTSILSGDPPCKWGILHSRRLDPGRYGNPIIGIDQYLSDLAAYRDDVHLASWQSLSVSAHAWDILGVIWQGQAATTPEVLSVVERRHWTEVETLAAISQLIKNSWITSDETLALTKKGKQVREEAEALTDESFFSPWQVLSNVEFERLIELLTQLNLKLEEINPKKD